MTEPPETQYVKTADGVHIAYQVFGEGPLDLVIMPTGVSHVEIEWDGPRLARFLRRLASFSRLICFDSRGVGLSDPISPRDWPTLEQRAQGALTVLDAVGSGQAALMGGLVGGQLAMFFAATYPGRTSALVLAGTAARLAWAPDYPWGVLAEEQESRRRQAEQGFDHGAGALRLLAPSALGDASFVSWWYRLYRHSVPPGAAHVYVDSTFATDLRSLLPTIRVPTLVVCRSGDQLGGSAHASYLADHIPGAKLIEFPGADNLLYVGDADAAVDEVEEFLTDTRNPVKADRVLATVLFTDIVGSTGRAVELGDSKWRELLDAHDRAVRRQLDRFRGREIDTVGDGFLATFDGPGRAVECACAIRDAVRALGVEVRAGLHTGEVELRDDDIAGIGVHVAARVLSHAGAGEVLTSAAVPLLVAGSGIEFEDRGEYELKGIPGIWRLFAVVS